MIGKALVVDPGGQMFETLVQFGGTCAVSQKYCIIGIIYRNIAKFLIHYKRIFCF